MCRGGTLYTIAANEYSLQNGQKYSFPRFGITAEYNSAKDVMVPVDVCRSIPAQHYINYFIRSIAFTAVKCPDDSKEMELYFMKMEIEHRQELILSTASAAASNITGMGKNTIIYQKRESM